MEVVMFNRNDGRSTIVAIDFPELTTQLGYAAHWAEMTVAEVVERIARGGEFRTASHILARAK
jgi:hypothetical protein